MQKRNDYACLLGRISREKNLSLTLKDKRDLIIGKALGHQGVLNMETAIRKN